MGKRVPALVEPSVLVWARESAGYTVEDIAQRFDKDPEFILAWEKGKTHPYVGQLRDLANFYKRVISDFYLPEPPEERPIPHDFRRSPGEIAGRYSPELRKQLRFARERQELADALYDILGEEIPAFTHSAVVSDDPEEVGEKIRLILDVSVEEQARWGDGYGALKAWRQRIEQQGVLVFQFEKVNADEAWGFSITDNAFPVICVNVDLAPNGRTFTILHEFTHLLLGESSICDIDDFTPRGKNELRLEVFCNHVAAAALMPQMHFLKHEIVRSKIGAATDWGDDEIEAIANHFGASREAVVRRLLTFERTTQAFYQEKRAFYRAQRAAHKLRQRERSKESEASFGRDYARRAISNLGGNFVHLILNSYREGQITLADAAKYLEVRAPKVQKVQELVLRG